MVYSLQVFSLVSFYLLPSLKLSLFCLVSCLPHPILFSLFISMYLFSSQIPPSLSLCGYFPVLLSLVVSPEFKWRNLAGAPNPQYQGGSGLSLDIATRGGLGQEIESIQIERIHRRKQRCRGIIMIIIITIILSVTFPT